MATRWVRQAGSITATSAVTLANNELVHNNARTGVGSITLVQKATVVSAYLFGISSTDDTWSMTLLVVDEAITPSYGTPQLDDPEVKGQFLFARGPLLYQPKRLIAIPSESSFMVRINKEQGGTSSTLRWHTAFLLQTSL